MRKYLKFLSPVMFLLSACQTNFTNRTVASGESENIETQFYETKLQQNFLQDQEKYQNKISDLYKKDSVMERNIIYDIDPKLKGKIEALEQRSNYYKNNLLKSAQNQNVPTAKTFSFDLPWRQHHDQFILQNLEAYELDNGKVLKQMVLSTDTTRRLILNLINKSYNWNGKAKPPSLQMGQPKPQDPHLKASLTCDQDVNRLQSSDTIRIPKGNNYEFDWYDESKNIPRTVFEISHPNTHCEFKFRKPDQYREYGIQFIPEAQQMKKISSPNLNYELCYMPKNSNLKGMDQFFTSADTDHMTCPQKADYFKTLEDPYEGIRAKIKLLTGKEISNEYIKAGDPFKPLDFSQAPKLDAVLISYLVFRSDFSGNVILEALKYHAKRGTIIRIAISDVITLRKDRQIGRAHV